MRVITLTLVMLMVTAAATAQEVARSFVELEDLQLLKQGDTIRVVCAYQEVGEYRELEGEFTSLTGSVLYLALDPPITVSTDLEILPLDGGGQRIGIPAERVASIIRGPRSSYQKGIGIGVLTGAAGGVVLGWGMCQSSDCDDDERAGPMALGVALGAGAGAALGALVASASDPSEELVYSAASVTESRFSYSLAPILSRKQRGVLFSVTW